MRKKISLILLIVIFALFTNGCTKEVSLIETKEEHFTTYKNDNISIKISKTVKEKENIYNTILEDLQKINGFSPIHNIEIDIDEKYVIPIVEDSIKCNSSFINTEEFRKELIKRSYDIYDNWISEGLYVKMFEVDIKEKEFAKYYEAHEFSLFGARFFEPFTSKEEVENVQAASIDLVEYLIKKEKKEELLKNQIEISDIEEWAKEKNIDLSYQKEIDSLMNRMEVNNLKPNIYLTINTKEDINGFIIDILTIDEQYDTSKKIEDTILKFDINIVQIREGIKKDAPNFYNDYSDSIENVPKIHYYFNINAKINSAEIGRGRIVLKNLLSQAHEYVHILIVDSFLANNIDANKPRWLDEGIANYLDMAYSDSSKLQIKRILSGISESKKYEDELSEEEKNLLDSTIKIFDANNINLSNRDKIMENKNERIRVSTILDSMGIKFSRYIMTEGLIEDTVYISGGESSFDQKQWAMDAGNYINYHANRNFTNYLIHEYGLEKLLYLMVEDFSTLTYEEYFGKSYEELKVEWIKYLKENIKAIELIL
ncbi:hypothetical protein RBU61_04745 [Tissierella sp. MB52-C2]|uniref:hypothetical protein n=1 Tax=Tissierella sp. MB52-C2 TaxID=3070999 RepID=UPI00280BAEF6|nr:hypothetical protein [Tissierella sp. MB52-C2]WMM25985.1 hypothetical protein RBU61_04745 [Tissierella sp. MB52-C2]